MDWNMFDNKGLKKREFLLDVLIFKVLFTCKSTQTNTRWFCISIKNTSTMIKTIWNRIITWIKKNFTKPIEKIIYNTSKTKQLINLLLNTFQLQDHNIDISLSMLLDHINIHLHLNLQKYLY